MNPLAPKDFVLFCAGEDSGDIIGSQALVAMEHLKLEARGVGGPLMQQAGLMQLANFDDLAVNGYIDVLFKYKSLKKTLSLLKKTIKQTQCRAVVLIDFPGFNMKLLAFAKQNGKPILYLSPPQIWAWKSWRAKHLRGVLLGVFFDWEQKAYQKQQCQTVKIEHPFLQASKKVLNSSAAEKKRVLFLLGSRSRQIQRNLELYTELQKQLHLQNSLLEIQWVLSRSTHKKTLSKEHQKNSIIAPRNLDERARLYAEAYYIVAHPGTAVLEASLVQSPVLAFSKIEFPSYLIGRFLLRIPCITLPNLITKKNLVSEVLSYKNSHLKKEIPYITENILKNTSKTSKHKNELIALQRACEGVTIQNLTLEFFMNIFDRDANHSRLSKG